MRWKRWRTPLYAGLVALLVGLACVSLRPSPWKRRYEPAQETGLLANPYQGWVAWAAMNPQTPVRYPFETVFVNVKWAEWEPEKGRFDLAGLEETYHLKEWKALGKRVLLRFVMDDVAPGRAKRMDIPAWLYGELAAENHGGLEGGVFYWEEALGGGGFSPNYESPLLLAYHEKAIQALAAVFDDPTATAFVQVGSLGHWGELHCWPQGSGVFPPEDVAQRYLEAYSRAFAQVKLAVRRPFAYTTQENWSLYNDMFGHGEEQRGWLATLPEGFWRQGYSGGEFAGGDARRWIGEDAIGETLALIRESHATLLGPCGPADILETDEDAAAYDRNVAAMARLMGARLRLESITWARRARPGETLNLEMTWENQGNAPFAYPWPVEFSLVEEGGAVARRWRADQDIRQWLPGTHTFTETIGLPTTLPAGRYILSVAIVDPGGGPSLALAMTGAGEDGRYPLYEIQVK